MSSGPLIYKVVPSGPNWIIYVDGRLKQACSDVRAATALARSRAKDRRPAIVRLMTTRGTIQREWSYE